jgi:hypothetical protein
MLAISPNKQDRTVYLTAYNAPGEHIRGSYWYFKPEHTTGAMVTADGAWSYSHSAKEAKKFLTMAVSTKPNTRPIPPFLVLSLPPEL